jgi:diketogulonate reductase-like aldo/keto reductase
MFSTVSVIASEVEESLARRRIRDVSTSLDMTERKNRMTRRQAARLIGGASGSLFLPLGAATARAANESSAMLMRSIPSSGEQLPVIGLGTWRAFDLEPARAGTVEPVLTRFVKLGGRVVDSSPMYGRAEEVIGQLVAKLRLRQSLFLATKVWTRGKETGIESMERSFARLRTNRIDLMQVHNLVDVGTQLATMRQWKQEGRFRYIGITHYEAGAFAEVEKILRRETLDFLQINYSVMEREAEERVLPLAQERGVAVIVNRPFGGGDLFNRVRGKPLPDFTGDFDCTSWAQFFLKWIIANPAVTCTIPATDKVQHLEDNMRAGSGHLPDTQMRRRMITALAGI